MLRLFSVGALASHRSCSPLVCSHRAARYTSIQETLKPTAGKTAGQISLLNEICCNTDAEEERRKPAFRHEVAPGPNAEKKPYLRTMYQWGYDSLTLFTRTNEDPGPWWNANASTLISTWSQIGDSANAGMWSGIWRYTYGVGEYNLRPCDARGRAWGRRDKKTGALTIRYGKPTQMLQKLVFPHAKEHLQHRRIKNPINKGFHELKALHGKRILREVQYHLGQGLRYYMVDGVFGSASETATPYRVFTDNPTHAYFLAMAAIRTSRYVARQEVTLVKRLSQDPLDEWGWRRPGVLVYHAPAFDFEAPRIVEEFGGPRPADMGLRSNRFIAIEPYSIPMKGIVSGEPHCDTLLDVTAFLAARWGFYADDKGMLTLTGDSVMSPDGKTLTLVITTSDSDADIIRLSPHLYGSRHHRVAAGIISRAWDVNSVPQAKASSIQPVDLIELDEHRVHQPLPTRMGLPNAVSHRLYGRRSTVEFGFKRPHTYTDDAASKAYAGGHLFAPPQKDTLRAHLVRPSHYPLAAVNVIVVGAAAAAATSGDSVTAAGVNAIYGVLSEKSFLYAEEAPLKEAIEAALKAVHSVKVIPAAAAKGVLQGISEKGQFVS